MSTQPPDRASRPVLLVHGIFDTGTHFWLLKRRLRKAGLEPHTIDLSPNNGNAGLDLLAEQVRDYVEGTFAPGVKIDLLGFSMGGLVSRYYLQRLGGVERVRRFVTLSAPHNGSLLAHVLRNPGCLQMRPGSSFLEDLNNDAHVLNQVGFVSLYTPFDLSIVPAASSHLPVGQCERFVVGWHGGMLISRRVSNRVIEVLREPAAASSCMPLD